MAKTSGDKAARGFTNVTHPENMALEIRFHTCQPEQVPVALLQGPSRPSGGGGEQETVSEGRSTPHGPPAGKQTCSC